MNSRDDLKKIKVVWSYSLYGYDYKKYYKPLLLNIRKYRNSEIIFVINTTNEYSNHIIQYFKDYLDYVNILVWDQEYDESIKILRFLVSNKVFGDYYFYKDSDSIVTENEILIMQNFILSSKNFMIIRNHPLHISPILAGMFGCSQEGSLELLRLMEGYKIFKKKNNYSYDQDYLTSNVYSKILKKAIVYTSHFYFFGENPVFLDRNNYKNDFIGRQYGVRNNHSYDRFYFQSYLRIPFLRIINKILPSIIYGRVRPSLYLGFIISKIIK